MFNRKFCVPADKRSFIRRARYQLFVWLVSWLVDKCFMACCRADKYVDPANEFM